MRSKKTFASYAVLAATAFLLSAYLLSILFMMIRSGVDEVSYNPLLVSYRAFKAGMTIGAPLACALGAVLLRFFMTLRSKEPRQDDRNFLFSDKGVYGTAGWLQVEQMVERELGTIGTAEETEGTILGQMDDTGTRLVATHQLSDLNKHIAVFGASGSGKSRGYVRPAIIQIIKRRESAIITDPKGELTTDIKEYALQNGYVFRTLDLVSPEFSDGWNCLKEIGGSQLRAQIFADAVIRNTGDSKGDIWDNSAMSLLKALSLRVERGRDYIAAGEVNLASVYDLITNERGEAFLEERFNPKLLTKEERVCIPPYMVFRQASPNMRGNILTALGVRLQTMQIDSIRCLTSTNDIDLTLPSLRPCIYTCKMSDQHSALSFMSAQFFSFLFINLVEYADSHGGLCPIPVNFLLDEFPNIGTIPDFEKKIATVRSRDIRISLVFQDIMQMQERYPFGKWESILSNCDTHLVLGVNAPTTAKYISERTGQATVQVKTEQHSMNTSLLSKAVNRYNNSTGDGKRCVILPDEVMRIQNKEALVIFRAENVIKIRKYDYGLHPEAKKLVRSEKLDEPDIWDDIGRAQKREREDTLAQWYEAEHPGCNDPKPPRKWNNNAKQAIPHSKLGKWAQLLIPNANAVRIVETESCIEEAAAIVKSKAHILRQKLQLLDAVSKLRCWWNTKVKQWAQGKKSKQGTQTVQTAVICEEVPECEFIMEDMPAYKVQSEPEEQPCPQERSIEAEPIEADALAEIQPPEQPIEPVMQSILLEPAIPKVQTEPIALKQQFCTPDTEEVVSSIIDVLKADRVKVATPEDILRCAQEKAQRQKGK